jgi:hypothetical protein
LVLGVENNDINEQEFETLSKLGVPITKYLVSYLLREVVVLLCLYAGHGLLSYQTHRRTSCELVKGTRLKNKECMSAMQDAIRASCINCPNLLLQKVSIRLLELLGYYSIWP